MLIANYVPGPINGVSQAPPQARPMDTCEVMEDCIATMPNILQRRPPWKLTKALTGGFTVGASPLWADIPRGSPATDVILLLNNEAGVITPRLFQASDGTAIALTVTPAATAYLALNAPTQPNQQFRICPIEDFVFITNRTVTVTDGITTAPTRNPEALLWVKLGQYGRQYSVNLTIAGGGGNAKPVFGVPTGATGSDALWVDTQVILKELYEWGNSPSGPGLLSTFPTNSTGFSGSLLNTLAGSLNFTLTGSTLYIQSKTATDFTIETTDGSGDTAMYAIKGSVQNFSDLPLVGHDGMVVSVKQSSAGGNSDFWVQYTSNGSKPAGGVWTECVAPGANLGLDPNKMPIAITVSGGVWTCDVCAWTGRTTGDATLAPDPGFVGDQITDIRWWRGRLALIYNGGVVLSASNSPFVFYPTTLATTLDSDPVGLLTPADRKTFFKQGVSFDQRLFIFADRVQASVATSGAAVTPSTVLMNPMAYSAFDDKSPIQQGNHKVRYLASRSASSIVYTLSIDRLSGLALEQDVSEAIPSYIPNTIDTASTWEADYITVWGTSGTADLYVAVYREKDYQSVQNAYFRWHTPTGYTLGGLFFKNGIILALVADANGLPYYVTLDTTPNYVTQARSGAAATVPQHMDFMLDESLVSSVAAAEYTTFTLPFPIPVNSSVIVALRAAFNGYPEGYIIPSAQLGTTSVGAPGLWHGAPIWLGIGYGSYFTPTRWYLVGQDKRPQHDGRLSMRRMKCDLSAYGYLRAEVTQTGRDLRTYEFNGYNLNDTTTLVDSPPNSLTATLEIPLGGRAEDLSVKFIADGNLGFKFLGYEWRADWNPTSRRVS